MGKTLAKLFGKKDMRILMLGLDAAGKTSILNMYITYMHVYMYMYMYFYSSVNYVCTYM